MKVTVEQNGGVSVLMVEGEVDMHCSSELRVEIQGLLKNKAKKLCFDLSKVKYMDSSGIATLIEAQQKLKKDKGELRLAAVPKMIQSVLDIAKLDQFFKIYPAVADALKDFK